MRLPRFVAARTPARQSERCSPLAYRSELRNPRPETPRASSPAESGAPEGSWKSEKIASQRGFPSRLSAAAIASAAAAAREGSTGLKNQAAVCSGSAARPVASGKRAKARRTRPEECGGKLRRCLPMFAGTRRLRERSPGHPAGATCRHIRKFLARNVALYLWMTNASMRVTKGRRGRSGARSMARCGRSAIPERRRAVTLLARLRRAVRRFSNDERGDERCPDPRPHRGRRAARERPDASTPRSGAGRRDRGGVRQRAGGRRGHREGRPGSRIPGRADARDGRVQRTRQSQPGPVAFGRLRHRARPACPQGVRSPRARLPPEAVRRRTPAGVAAEDAGAAPVRGFARVSTAAPVSARGRQAAGAAGGPCRHPVGRTPLLPESGRSRLDRGRGQLSSDPRGPEVPSRARHDERDRGAPRSFPLRADPQVHDRQHRADPGDPAALQRRPFRASPRRDAADLEPWLPRAAPSLDRRGGLSGRAFHSSQKTQPSGRTNVSLCRMSAEPTPDIRAVAEALGIPWRRILESEIDSERSLRRSLAGAAADEPLWRVLCALPSSALDSWRVRERVNAMACEARTGRAPAAARELLAVFDHLRGKGKNRGSSAGLMARHFWLAYQRVQELVGAARAAEKSRGDRAMRLQATVEASGCAAADAEWALERSASSRRDHRVDDAVRRARSEGFEIPRAGTAFQSFVLLRKLARKCGPLSDSTPRRRASAKRRRKRTPGPHRSALPPAAESPGPGWHDSGSGARPPIAAIAVSSWRS